MPVPEQIPYVGYIANGQTTEFPITFDLHDPEFLIVTLNKEIPLVGAYTIDMNAKKVVFATAPNDNDQVELYRETELNRDIDYKSFDNSFRPEAVNYDLDTVMRILQEQNMIDAKIASKIKGEIEWRRTHDANFDELSKMRDAQIFSGLKQYLDTILAMTNPNIFDGIGAGIVFALDKKSVQTHLEIIYDSLQESETNIELKASKIYVDEKDQAIQAAINTEILRATSAENGIQVQVNSLGVGNRSYKTYVEMDSDKANIQTKSKVTVTNDSTPSNNGDWQWDGSTFTKSIYDPLAQAKAYTDSFDALKINKGKVFPFKSMSRNGITSPVALEWNNLILDVSVENAELGKYYQIAYQQNGALINGKNEYNWIIQEFDAATYNTSAVASIVVNYTDAGQQQLVKDGTIQTVNIKSLTKPKLLFKITCDTSALPVGTSPVNSTAQGSNSWSHIIDPQRYFTNETLINIENAPRNWLYNKGPHYPFIQSAFNGATSATPSLFLNIIKDFEVINAADGYYYQLAYYTNGNTATGADRQERWIIHKRPRTGYTAAGATQEQIVTLTIPQETLVKSGGIEKIRLVSAGQEYFDLTVDTSKLPAYGTFISAANASDAGYSWFMSATNYRKKISSDASVSSFNAYVNYVASTKTFSYRYRSKDKLYEIVFGPNGANSLPNFRAIGQSSGTELTGSFTTIQAFSTDWLPPLVFYAVNNQDDSNYNSFTGGNHASNGDATGDPTAENELYSIFVDGNALNMAQDFSGACKSIDVKLVHKLMASNTKTTSKRFCLKQIFDLNFNGSNINVHCKLRSLEDIKLRSDYGPQLTTQGFNSTQLMLDSSATTRVAYDNNATSGVRSSYPKAFALILKGSGGILSSWIDRSYGNGTPQNCAPDQPLIRGGTATNHKFYHCAFRSMLSDEVAFPPLLITASNIDYKWRGGYVVQSDNQDGIYDSVLKLDQQLSIVNGVTYY